MTRGTTILTCAETMRATLSVPQLTSFFRLLGLRRVTRYSTSPPEALSGGHVPG